jgi:hypothetical protein
MKITWKQLKEILKRKARRAGIKTTGAATCRDCGLSRAADVTGAGNVLKTSRDGNK